MASSKNWALYATKYRLGQLREHQLAGARLRQFGVMLSWTILHGWKATVHGGRVGVEFSLAPRRDIAVTAAAGTTSRPAG